MRDANDRESDALAARVVACLPAASYEMETLCRLAAVTASREVPTAAVTCSDRPRMLLNPDFVAASCQRDEHLFLLVMHELWHVLLAHTTLYPRPDEAHNLAFDAVINAGLARQFPAPEYRGFLDALNPPDTLPGLLLRPPEGWPARPRYPKLGGRLERLLYQLYPVPGVERAMPTYRELVEAISEAACGGAALLLGDHGGEAREERLVEGGRLGEVVREIVAGWPPPPFPLGGRDAGRTDAESWLHRAEDPAGPARRAFEALLRRVLGPPGVARRPTRTPIEVVGGPGVVPNPRDRLAPARRLLGVPPTLWAQPVRTPARLPERTRSTLVYLDVSGSMDQLLPRLVGLLLPYVAEGRAEVFQFSTAVAPLPLSALRRGELTTTYGTDVNPVLEHALERPRARALLLVTDGFTGPPRAHLAASLEARRVRVHVALPAESAYRNALEALAASITVLPNLESGRRP